MKLCIQMKHTAHQMWPTGCSLPSLVLRHGNWEVGGGLVFAANVNQIVWGKGEE